MYLEATAVDLGGKLTSGKPYWRDFGWICVPKCSPPETPRFEVGFGELCFTHLGVKCKDGSNILGRLQLCFLKQSWGILRASWAIGKPCSSPVGAFCSAILLLLQPEMLSRADFKWASASYAGSIWGQSTAILWRRWCHVGAKLGDFGANFGDFGAVLKAIWDHFRPCYFGILKNNPKLYLQNALPSGPRGATE